MITDTDSGFAKAIAELEQLDGVVVDVGIDDAVVAPYALAHEAHTGFMRDTVDGLDLDDELAGIQRAAVDGDAGKAVDELGAKVAGAIKGRIEELGLVQTGRMRDSVKAEVARG